jgi:hypothetical protein
MRRTKWLASGLLVLVLGAAPGCGSNELDSPTANKLRGLAKLYLDCAVSKSGPGPANEEEFKKHLRRLEGFVLKMNGVDPAALDEAFVSERDGEPFVIRYGVSIGHISGTSAPLVAHEKTGKNGKRLVAFANAKVEAVDEARFQELMSATK